MKLIDRYVAAVPTFDITDLAKTGPVFGGALSYKPAERLLVVGEFDYGTHDLKGASADVIVSHYMAKVGYLVYEGAEGKLKAYVNLGLGAVSFDPDVNGADTNTYFAINAGAKVYYHVTPLFSVVPSPQGDIAFTSKDDGFTGSTAWVWSFTAGVAFSF